MHSRSPGDARQLARPPPALHVIVGEIVATALITEASFAGMQNSTLPSLPHDVA